MVYQGAGYIVVMAYRVYRVHRVWKAKQGSGVDFGSGLLKNLTLGRDTSLCSTST